MFDLKIRLASASPRRRELLGWTGIPFEVTAADVDETPEPGETPADYVLRLAQKKGSACVCGEDGWFVLAADTTVSDGTEILGKPTDPQDARRMLEMLRGNTHAVHTAIALINPDGWIFSDLCTSPVTMREYNDDEMEAYITSGDPLDKAGAYAIQNEEFHPVENFQGCIASVMGLPLCHMMRTLERAGISAPKKIPFICQSHFQYRCPISKTILSGENVG